MPDKKGTLPGFWHSMVGHVDEAATSDVHLGKKSSCLEVFRSHSRLIFAPAPKVWISFPESDQ